MASRANSLDPDLELAVLRFWAQGLSLSQEFSRAQIASVPGLADAIAAVRPLPEAIGRADDDDPPPGRVLMFTGRRAVLRPD